MGDSIAGLFAQLLLRREMLCAIPPSAFLEKISCLVRIVGDIG